MGRCIRSSVVLGCALVLCAGHGAQALPPTRTELLDRAVLLAETARRDLLTDRNSPYSPAGVVLRVGSDPGVLAAFVRDRVRYEPCLGVVRGPQGTLAAMGGGDWDRAVLLQALFREAGYTSRLVVARRGDAERRALVDAFLETPGRERTLGAAGPRTLPKLPPLDPALARLGVTMPNREFDLSRGLARWNGMLDEAYDAAASLAPTLASAMGDLAKGRPLDEWRRELMEAAAEQVAVEIDRPEVRRFDLGPDRAAAKWSAAESPRKATLDLILRMEVAGKGAPDEPVTLLERRFDLGDLFCKSIRFQIAPDASAAEGKPVSEWSEQEWFDFLSGFERFQALLEIDRLWIASDAFDVFGRTFKVKGDGRIEAAKKMGAHVHRSLGGFGQTNTQQDAPPETRIGALTLHLVLNLPGEEPVHTRRLLYGDLRKDVSPVYHTDLLVFGGPVGPDSVLWRRFDVITGNAPFLARALGSSGPDRLRETVSMRVVSQMLHEWQLARLALASRFLEANPDLGFRGGPALVMKTAFLIPDATTKGVRRRTVIDVVHDGQMLVPRRPSADPVRANLALGVASTILESLLLRERRPDLSLKGAYAAFESAALRGETLVTASASDLGTVEPTALSRWAIETGEAGRVLLFPQSKEVSAWWSIDPTTGVTLGRGDGGEGQSMAEYKAAIDTALKNLKCMTAVLKAASTESADAQTAYEWAKCVTDFDPEKPSSYVGAYGKYEKEMHGLEMWSEIADRLSSLEDAVEEAQQKKDKGG